MINQFQVDIHAEYDLVQLIGEGWYSRVYLAEQRTTRDEVVLKAINSNLVTADEFCREYQNSIGLWPHKNILKVIKRQNVPLGEEFTVD